MKIISFGIKIFLDAYRDTVRIIKHFRLIALNGFIIIPKLFLIRLIYTLSFFRNLIKVKIRDNESFDEYFVKKGIYSKDLTYKIDKDGCSKTYMLKDNLKEELLNEAIHNRDLEYKQNKNIDQNILIKKKQENIEDYFDRLINENISRVTGFIDLKKDSRVKTFLTSKPIISFAKNYLNSQSFSISASFFVSNPIEISKKEKYANAQFFHWDNDFSKFLKLYIYLTDVDEASGPHVYIPKSHKKKELESSLPRLYDDNFIYSSYEEKIEYKGKAGSIFFTDGYGLHKGETPQKKSRLVLNVHFGRNKILYSNKDIFYNSNN